MGQGRPFEDGQTRPRESLLRHQTTHLGSADGSNTQPQQQETLIVRGAGLRERQVLQLQAKMCGCGRLAVVVCGPISRSQQTFCDEPPVPGPGRPGTPELRLPTIALGRPGCMALLLATGCVHNKRGLFLMRLKKFPEPTFPDADLVTGPAV